MKKPFIILLHTGYWILYLLLIVLFMLFMNAGISKSLNHNYSQVSHFFITMSMLTLIPALISYYIFYGILFERFLSKRKVATLCLAGLATVVVSAIIGLSAFNLLMDGLIFRNNGFGELLIIILFLSVLALVHGVIALVMRGFISWYADIKIKAALQQKNFETELALVKSQLDPHFLFNTINNIDVLIEKDAGRASAYLNKLSDIMRFMLYETKTEWITLQKELAYIEKYIELQKIRSFNHNFVQFAIEGDSSGWMIAPMLFIPFIENAFKHSLNKKTCRCIEIRLTITDKQIDFYCENEYATNPIVNGEAGGLGKSLIEKRLALLYPGQHTLTTADETSIYKVRLRILR